MQTERIDPRFADLDTWPTADVLAAMLEGQLAAVAAVRAALPAITLAVDAAAQRLGTTGRLIYVGAGTSGRIGVQDGSELPPTFSWPLDRVEFLMAGGPAALLRSAEGAEDDTADGRHRIDALAVGRADVVIGLAASGTTPFTVAAIKRARKRGALTIGIACNAGTPLLKSAQVAILTDTGPEVISGSTRMKAGTAHKAVLNLLSSAIMVRLGRVYGGIMVDMKPTNAKLERRAAAIVAHIAECSPAKARQSLRTADGNLKLAVLLALGASAAAARASLTRAKGNLRKARIDSSK